VEAVPPWQLKYIGLGSHDSFAELDPNHGNIGCATCHGGDPNAYTATEAHGTDFLADPASDPITSCGSVDCHPDLAADFTGSIHMNIWGMKQQLADRAGYADFNSCPADLQTEFNGECASCHATCGDCHISRPNSVGGGLVDNHIFLATPDRQDNCQACHGSRVGVDFEGQHEDVVKDIHRWNGFQCEDCHSGEEMHADVTGSLGRYFLGELTPACTDCHYQESPAGETNVYHAQHWPGGDIELEWRHDCYVCHSQAYNNCDACHVGGVWKTNEDYHERNPYELFKIGRNITYDTADYDDRGHYVAVRHAPVVRDTYAPWGLLELAAFDEIPNWKYATPHNTQLWTRQTGGSVDGPEVTPTTDNCFINCHPHNHVAQKPLPQNRVLFLTEADLAAPEYSEDPLANHEVVVDDDLPDSWVLD